MNKRNIVSLLLLMFLLSGCLVGPKYIETMPDLPEKFSFGSDVDSITNIEWWESFTNPVLDSVIANALRNNYEVSMALSRLERLHLLLEWPRQIYCLALMCKPPIRVATLPEAASCLLL